MPRRPASVLLAVLFLGNRFNTEFSGLAAGFLPCEPGSGIRRSFLSWLFKNLCGVFRGNFCVKRL
jgi:hypothetical protein